MAGTINSTGNPTIANSIEAIKQQSGATRVNSRPEVSAPQANTGDSVVLTGTAQKLRDLEKQLTEQPVVNDEKVNALRNAILSGTYKFDPNRVAEKMINFETQLKDKLG